MNAANSQVLFFRWLAKNHPKVYAPVARDLDAARVGDLAGWADTLVTALATVGSAVIAKKQADKQLSAQRAAEAQSRADQLRSELLQVNLQRAQSGLPPVDERGNIIPASQLPTLPSAQAAYQAAMRPASFIDSIPLWGWLAGAGVVLFFVLKE